MFVNDDMGRGGGGAKQVREREREGGCHKADMKPGGEIVCVGGGGGGHNMRSLVRSLFTRKHKGKVPELSRKSVLEPSRV